MICKRGINHSYRKIYQTWTFNNSVQQKASIQRIQPTRVMNNSLKLNNEFENSHYIWVCRHPDYDYTVETLANPSKKTSPRAGGYHRP